MKRIAMMALVALMAGLLGGCANIGDDPDNRRGVGAVGGAVLGAFVGYSFFGSGSGQTIMAILGAGAGAAGGVYAVDEIIKRDKKKMQKAAYESLNGSAKGETVYWENPDTGSAGSFTVLRSYTARDGRLCRDIAAKAMGDRQTTDRRRTACRLGDGGWEIL